MAVSYSFRVVIPSLKRKVSFREITIRDLISINKSIVNNDYEEISECFDRIIESCCIEKGLVFTMLDKVVILLSIRAYSVSTFCALTIKDHEQGEDFEHNLEVNKIIESILALEVESEKSFKLGELQINYGIPYRPIRDVNNIQVSDYIHTITKDDEVLVKPNASPDDLKLYVESLPFELFQEIQSYAKDLYKVFEAKPLYVISSPFFRSRILVEQKMGLDFRIYDVLKLLYTENLHNLYRSIYNFNQTLNISPLYTENLIPVEKDLLWGYYIKDQRDAELAKASGQKSGNFNPNA